MNKVAYWLFAMLVCLAGVKVYAGSCVWDPAQTDWAVGDVVLISAEPGDPAPDDQGECECIPDGSPGEWHPTGGYSVTYGGDIVGGNLDTSSPGVKTVTADISYEYSCSTSGETMWIADVGNTWSQDYSVSTYYIEGPRRVDVGEPNSYEAKSTAGITPSVTSWDAESGSISGSGHMVDATWSAPGITAVTAEIDGYGTISKLVEVMGDLNVYIASPDHDPYLVAKGEEVTFVAGDMEEGAEPFSYEWKFERGNAPIGEKFKHTASGVKYGSDAEGKRNVVELTVRDDLGNSGWASMEIIVPKIRITRSVVPDDLFPSEYYAPNYTGFDTTETNGYYRLKAKVTPSDIDDVDVYFSVSYLQDAEHPGNFPDRPDGKAIYTTVPEPHYFTDFQPRGEAKTNILQNDPILNTQGLLFKGDLVHQGRIVMSGTASGGTTINAKFKVLSNSVNAQYQKALDYTFEKYSISTTNACIYDPLQGSDSYGLTDPVFAVMRLGSAAFSRGEQWLRSIIRHEGVHQDTLLGTRVAAALDEVSWKANGGSFENPDDHIINAQLITFGAIFSAVELQAWTVQLNHAADDCLVSSDIQEINDKIDLYLRIYIAATSE